MILFTCWNVLKIDVHVREMVQTNSSFQRRHDSSVLHHFATATTGLTMTFKMILILIYEHVRKYIYWSIFLCVWGCVLVCLFMFACEECWHSDWAKVMMCHVFSMSVCL